VYCCVLLCVVCVSSAWEANKDLYTSWSTQMPYINSLSNWQVGNSKGLISFLLKIAVTLASFQSLGTSLLLRDLIKSSATVPQISSDYSNNILVPIESTPGVLLTRIAPQYKAQSCDRMSSVRLSVCDIGGSWPHRLKILETNCAHN